MDRPFARIEEILGDQGGRRRDLRFICQLPGTLTTDRGEFACEIVNLSHGGLSAHCQEKLTKGESVKIALRNPGPGSDPRPLSCEVAWVTKTSQESQARLALAESPDGTWLESELQALASKAKESRQRRSRLRVACRFPGRVVWNGGAAQVQVIDLGSHGARVECSSPLVSDQSLVLELDAIEGAGPVSIKAAVVAPHDSDAGVYGLAFAGFQTGGPSELSVYLNWSIKPRRS